MKTTDSIELRHVETAIRDAIDHGCTDDTHDHIREYRKVIADFLRRQHAAVYNDAGRHTADGILRAADLIDPDKDTDQ